MKLYSLLLFAFSIPLATPGADAAPFAPYESASFAASVSGTRTGAFHVETIGGRDWVIDPLGRGTLFFGVQSANYKGVYSQFTRRARYQEWNQAHGGSRAWRERTISRLRGWGFNFLGHGCERVLERQGLAHAHDLHLGQRFCADGQPADRAISSADGHDACRALPDMFHPDFAAWCREDCAKNVAPYRDDPWTAGWFIDNELKWNGTGDRDTGFFDAVRKLPADRPARRALEAFVATRPVTPELKKEFLLFAARRYFQVTSQAIREADPKHLVLGCRFAGLYNASEAVWRAAGESCEIVTVNVYPWCDLDSGAIYTRQPNPCSEKGAQTLREALDVRHEWAKRPLMISEWSFRAIDAGHPNSAGAGQIFRTQEERAQAAELFLSEIGQIPYVVGHNFFRWVDQPPEGIRPKNREDGNYGLVNEQDAPYAPLVDVFSRRQSDVRKFRSPGAQRRTPPPVAKRDSWEAFLARPTVVARQAGAAYEIENGEGFRARGEKGRARLLDSVTLAGQDFGSFGLTVGIAVEGKNEWMPATNVVAAGVRTAPDGAAAELRLRVLGGNAAHGFAARLSFRFEAGRSRIRAKLLDLVNDGPRPYELRGAFFAQSAPVPVRDDAFRAPQDYRWKVPMTGGWITDDGRWAAAISCSPMAKFRYWTDERGRQHPDAAFYAPRQPRLAPGDAFDFDGQAEALLVYGFGGLNAWLDVLRRL